MRLILPLLLSLLLALPAQAGDRQGAQTAGPAASADPCAMARADWRMISGTESRAVLEAFIATHDAQCALLAKLAAERAAALATGEAADVCIAARAAWAALGASDTLSGAALADFAETYGATCPALASQVEERLAALAGSRPDPANGADTANARHVGPPDWTRAVSEELGHHRGWVKGADISSDGLRVVTVANDAFRAHSARFGDEDYRAVLGEAYAARIWEIGSGDLLRTLKGHEDDLNSVSFSPDGHRVVTASHDRTARVFDAASGEERLVLGGHEHLVYSAVFSPDGKYVLTASFDRTARLWDAATGREAMVFEGHVSGVRRAAFSPDGRHVVTASSDRSVRIWSAETGKQTARFEGHDGPVVHAAFSPDGRLIVTGSEDGTAYILNAVTGHAVTRLSGHSARVNSAVFSPDGRHVATASRDMSARIWETTSGNGVARLPGHDNEVWDIVFAPDGRRIVTASLDGTVRLWTAR